MVQVRLLGPVDVAAEGVIRPVRGLRRKAVLSVLALQRGQIVSADRLIDVVWGDTAAEVAVNTLQSHISHLRGVLGDRDAILARPPGYLLGPAAGAVDVEVAEDLIDRAEHTADAAEQARHSEAALGLWRGSPLLDVTGLPWLEEQARRLDGLRLRATHAWIDLWCGEDAGWVGFDRVTMILLAALSIVAAFHQPSSVRRVIAFGRARSRRG